MVDVKKTMATTLISSKQWPQPEVHDPSSISMATDKINPPSLKCPRCDSSNTKFCYYNNYSLSQPRHFCKACKRYWTRGGTLRNVPVGGGCRKNKRLKRPQLGISNSTPTSAVVNPSFDQSLNSNQIDHSSFYNSRSSDPNFTIPSLIRVPAGFDFHPPMNLGFSSSTISDDLIRGMQSSHPTVWNPNPDPNPNPNPNPNPTEHVMSSDPSSSLLWWFDPSTMGSSSVPSLI